MFVKHYFLTYACLEIIILQVLALQLLPVQEMLSTPGTKYSMMDMVPPLTVRMPASLRMTSLGLVQPLSSPVSLTLVVDLLNVGAALQEQRPQLHVSATGGQGQGRLETVSRHVHLQWRIIRNS